MPFDALGFTFSIDVDDARLDAIGAHLAELYEPCSTAGRADHRYRLTRRDGEQPDDDLYELSLDGESVLEVRRASQLISALVHDVNRRAILDCPHLVLHAGGVEHAGVGIALPGVGEAGKTTLTAGLVRAGLRYLSDEAVAVDRSTLAVHPYPKPLSIDRGAWALFPELEPAAELVGVDEVGQWQVPAAKIRPDALGGPCGVDVIVFPRFEPGVESRVEPLGRAEALVEVSKHTFRFNEQSREALDLLAEVVRGAECHRLTMGDLASAVTAVLHVR